MPEEQLLERQKRGDLMRLLRKEEMALMGLTELELRKNRAFSQILKGKNARMLRNMLYEMLGVIEFKRKFEIPSLEVALA